MKTFIFGLVVISALLIAPAYAAECGGGEFEPFTHPDKNNSEDERNTWNQVLWD